MFLGFFFLSFFLSRGLNGFIVSYSKQSQLDHGSAGIVIYIPSYLFQWIHV
ncbi:hypothetical protein POPTR_004G067750v4 [Populus trichocarpa]|uniref:Uncharacterized protein n=1 Tax=Populus trichocarpa TaxID=3694 RepID=A0ACC0T3S2_POPTR|nr:hypothetical protein POPTR_004G067750v4 [Populus trichocarpa]